MTTSRKDPPQVTPKPPLVKATPPKLPKPAKPSKEAPAPNGDAAFHRLNGGTGPADLNGGAPLPDLEPESPPPQSETRAPSQPEPQSTPTRPTPEEVAEAAGVFDDVEALKRSMKPKISVKSLLVNIPVGRPKNNVFFRSHPNPALVIPGYLLANKDDSELFFVAPSMREHPAVFPRMYRVDIVLISLWPGGNLGLWPVRPIEDATHPCWRSECEALRHSRTHWAQIAYDRSTKDHAVRLAEGIDLEPTWPNNLNISELLRLGFPLERIIASAEHPYVRRLRGLAD